MVNLRCGCEVTEEGKFVVGDGCRMGGCKECTTLETLHPFGNERL